MGGTKSCARLRAEHELIGEVLGVVEMLTARMRVGAAVPMPPVAGAIDFFSTFVEGCHEAKEEEALFPVLAAYGPPDGASLTALRSEHEEGRWLVGALRPRSGRLRLDGTALGLIEAYIALLRQHMANEDTALFPWAEGVLSPPDERRLARAFDRVEEQAVGPGGREVVLALGDAVMQACRAIGSESPKGVPVLARDVMQERPGVVAPEESLGRAAELMASLRTRELPVVDRGTLVGILTRTDMEPHRGHLEWTAVRAAMTPRPMSAEAGAPVAAVARLLLTRSFNALPVVDGGRLVGMIRRSDLLRLLAGEAGPADPQPGG
jgi:CBS domain-containing protein